MCASNASSASRDAYLATEEAYQSECKYRELRELYLDGLGSQDLELAKEEIGYIHHKLAIVCTHLGRDEEAEIHFRESLRITEPRSSDSVEDMDIVGNNYYNLYLLTKDSKFANSALDTYRGLLKKYPDYDSKRNLYLEVSDLLLRLARYDEALDMLSKTARLALSTADQVDNYHAEAMIRQCKKEYAAAEKLYRKSLEFTKNDKPLHTKLYSDLARLYLDMGETSKAIENCRLSLESLKDCPWLRDKESYLREVNALMEACQQAK